MVPRTPFPSFTLVLSRQTAGDISVQERNVEPPIDLMKTFDSRSSGCNNWKMRHTLDSVDGDRSERETIFEEQIGITAVNNKGSNKQNRCLRNISVIFRMLRGPKRG